MIRSLNQLIKCRGKPSPIKCYNGHEYISNDLKEWPTNQGVVIEYIEPDNAQQNTYVERFNKIVHYDQLNQELFNNVYQVKKQAEAWLPHYNTERPNMSNGRFTPIQKLNITAQPYLFGALNTVVFPRYQWVYKTVPS